MKVIFKRVTVERTTIVLLLHDSTKTLNQVVF